MTSVDGGEASYLVGPGVVHFGIIICPFDMIGPQNARVLDVPPKILGVGSMTCGMFLFATAIDSVTIDLRGQHDALLLVLKTGRH